MNTPPSARDIIELLIDENRELTKILEIADRALEELYNEANDLEKENDELREALAIQKDTIDILLDEGTDDDDEDFVIDLGGIQGLIPADIYMEADTILVDDTIVRDLVGLEDNTSDAYEFALYADIVVRDGEVLKMPNPSH